MIEENSTNSAHFVAVFDEKVIIAPIFETFVEIGIEFVANRFHALVKIFGQFGYDIMGR
jgi:hypothetical protein